MNGRTYQRAGRRARTAACLLVVSMLGACAAPAPAPSLDPLPMPPPPLVPQSCMVCADSSDEIARLRQALASREAELRELRASQRDQAKVAAATTRDATQAQARQRRLATQADAASAVAEAEVAQDVARERVPLAPVPPLFLLAQAFLDAATTEYARGDYGAALDRAAQAQALLVALPLATGPGARAVEIPLRMAVPVQATARAALQKRPGGATLVTVDAFTPLVAQAYRAGYLRVTGENGKRGWVPVDRLGVR